jgi:hypothetical protein
MKRISLGIVLSAVGLSNSLKVAPQEDGASIRINWSNNKGESKVFKIDDVEQDLGHEKIHSKTLLQQYCRTSYPDCSSKKSCSLSRKKRSCSFERSCSFGKKRYTGSVFCKPSKPFNVCKVKKYRKPIIIEHRPVYKKHITYYPKKKQNKLFNKKYYDNSNSRSSSTEDCYKKDYSDKEKRVSLKDLEKLVKENRQNADNQNSKGHSASRLRKSDQVSKYLKDQDKKCLKKNNERSCSNQAKNAYKYAKANKNANNANKDCEKFNENEFKDSHNTVNLADKKNEALCM